MEGIYSVGTSSASTIYGNIGSAIKEYIISHFPNNFFNYTNISSELAFRNMKRQFGSNTDVEITKRHRPYLIIKPSYSVPSDDVFLFNTPLTKNTNDIEYGIDQRHLFPIIKDIENNYALKFKMNRDRIEYDITISVSTLLQQIDTFKAMQNQLTWDNTFSHICSLESLIPRTMISLIGRLNNLDIDDISKDNIPKILNRLNRFSKYPITYKIRNASSIDEFFMYYNHKIMLTFSDLSLDSASKKNMVDESYDINFRVTAEFNLPGLYILQGNNDNLYNFQIDLQLPTPEGSPNEFIPLYTMANLYNKYPPLYNGYTLYTSSIFNVEEDIKKNPDYLDISPIFETNILQILRENALFSENINSLIYLIIIKDDIPLIINQDWSIDWEKFRVKIEKPEKYSTYRLIIYLDMIKINLRLSDIRESTINDKSHI